MIVKYRTYTNSSGRDINIQSLIFIGALKERVSPNNEPISFPMRLTMAGVSGAFGGVVGAPADMVNVRMQNDVKLPIDSDQRRNYKHAIDGLIRIIREEGVMKVILLIL